MKSAENTLKNWLIKSSHDFFDLEKLKRVDVLLLSLTLALVTFGLIMVYSSSYIYALDRAGDGLLFIKKQGLFAILGLVVLFAGLRVRIDLLEKYAVPILILGTLLLAAVYFPGIGHKVGGAQRWIKLGPLQFQPVEIFKLVAVLFVARQLHRKKDRLHLFGAGVASNFILLVPALLMMLLQPDFGSFALLLLVVTGMIFLAGVPIRFIAGLAGVLAVVGTSLIWVAPYRMARLTTFLDPWADPMGQGFQILQSFLGFHSGEFWGVGLGSGRAKLFFLPEAHNDFIFSVIGEELGFIGVAAVVAVFSLLVFRGFHIGLMKIRKNRDYFSGMLALGLSLLIGLQAFINMGVVMGVLPTKGLNLPLISYGGSALILNLFAIGVLLQISDLSAKRENSA